MRTRCVCSGELCEQRTPPPKRGCTPCSPNSPAVVPMAALSARMALLVIGACHDKKEGRAGIPPFLFLGPPAGSASPARYVESAVYAIPHAAPFGDSPLPGAATRRRRRYPAPLPCVDYTVDQRGLARARCGEHGARQYLQRAAGARTSGETDSTGGRDECHARHRAAAAAFDRSGGVPARHALAAGAHG